MDYISCDFCGHQSATLLYQFNDTINNKKNRFTYVECENCHLIYLNPRPSKEEILDYYPESYAPYKKNIYEEKNILIRTIRLHNVKRTRKWIEKKTKMKNGSILDIGCSTGTFLNEMQKNGWTASGVELSEFASNYAKNKFNLHIENCSLENAHFDPNSFDVITFWDVLEHTYSPTQQLELSHKLLKTNGLLIINIPNWSSFDNKLLKRHWVGFDPPRHLYIFKNFVLTKMLEKYNFEVLEKICFISSYYGFVISIENWLSNKSKFLSNIIKRVLMVPGIRFFFEPFLFPINKLGYGTVITFIAQKV